MPVIVLANPKGGVGKSTLSTNVAGYWARQGHAVMLGDIDQRHRRDQHDLGGITFVLCGLDQRSHIRAAA